MCVCVCVCVRMYVHMCTRVICLLSSEFVNHNIDYHTNYRRKLIRETYK